MLPPNDYLAMKDYELNRLPDVLARAEQHRLLVEAGLIRRSRSRTFGVAHLPGVPIVLAVGAPVGDGRATTGTRYAPMAPDPA